MNLVLDIGTILKDAGLVTLAPTSGFTFFDHFLPDNQSAAAIAVIYGYPGREAGRTHDDFEAIQRPRFQLRMRGLPNADDPAKGLAVDAMWALSGYSGALASGARAIIIRCLTHPGFLERDELGRASFTTNYEMEVNE